MALKCFQEPQTNIITKDALLALITQEIPRVWGAVDEDQTYIIPINHHIAVNFKKYLTSILLSLYYHLKVLMK